MTSPNQTTSAIQTITASNLVRTPVSAQSGPGLSRDSAIRRPICCRLSGPGIRVKVASGGQPAVPGQRPTGGQHGLAELVVPGAGVEAAGGPGALGTSVLTAARYRKRVMPQVLDIEQAVLLLELEPPFDKRDVQLARRRLAKRWHPDIAPPGKQHEHERHLKAINEAADQLAQIAEDSRGGRSPRTRSRSPRPRPASAAPRRAPAPTPRSSASARAPSAPSTTRSARACPTTRSCTATRAASPIRSGAWGASTGSTSPAAATTSSSGRASPSSPASAPCPRARCSSWTSPSPTRAPSAWSGS